MYGTPHTHPNLIITQKNQVAQRRLATANRSFVSIYLR